MVQFFGPLTFYLFNASFDKKQKNFSVGLKELIDIRKVDSDFDFGPIFGKFCGETYLYFDKYNSTFVFTWAI